MITRAEHDAWLRAFRALTSQGLVKLTLIRWEEREALYSRLDQGDPEAVAQGILIVTAFLRMKASREVLCMCCARVLRSPKEVDAVVLIEPGSEAAAPSMIGCLCASCAGQLGDKDDLIQTFNRTLPATFHRVDAVNVFEKPGHG